nr:glutamate [NMDA] receptor subunit 1 isoform X2 [Halyomorpha halys]
MYNVNFLRGVSDKRGRFQCINCVFIASTVEIFINILKTRPVDTDKFLSIIININDENVLYELSHKDVANYLTNWHGVVIDLKAPHFLYRYIPLHKTFKTYNLSDIRNREIGINYGSFGGRKLRVGTFNCSVNSQIGPLDAKGRPSWLGGVEMIFLDAITQKLNFTYEIILPPDGEGVGGRLDKYGNLSKGLVGLVLDQSVDVAFCGIWQTNYINTRSLSISSPIQEVCITYLVPRPLPFNQMGLGLFTSFEGKVWMLIFISIITTAISSQLIAFMAVKHGFSNFQLIKFLKPNNSLLQLWSILCNNAPKSLATFGPLRHVLLWWAVYSLLLNAMFSSSLVSHLTATLYDKPLDSIQALVENDYYWSLNGMPYLGSILNSSNEWGKKWVKRFHFKSEKSLCSILQVDNNKLAMFAVNYDYGVMLEENIECKHLLRKYQTLPDCISKYRTVFLLRHRSPYRELFSDYITRYRENGMFQKQYRELFYKKILKDNYISEVRLPLNINSAKKVKLRLSNTLAIFYIYGLGIMISFVVFLLELLWYRKSYMLRIFV